MIVRDKRIHNNRKVFFCFLSFSISPPGYLVGKGAIHVDVYRSVFESSIVIRSSLLRMYILKVAGTKLRVLGSFMIPLYSRQPFLTSGHPLQVYRFHCPVKAGHMENYLHRFQPFLGFSSFVILIVHGNTWTVCITGSLSHFLYLIADPEVDKYNIFAELLF